MSFDPVQYDAFAFKLVGGKRVFISQDFLGLLPLAFNFRLLCKVDKDKIAFVRLNCFWFTSDVKLREPGFRWSAEDANHNIKKLVEVLSDKYTLNDFLNVARNNVEGLFVYGNDKPLLNEAAEG